MWLLRSPESLAAHFVPGKVSHYQIEVKRVQLVVISIEISKLGSFP